MIPRYSPPDMAALFTDAARFGLWLEVELLATEAQALARAWCRPRTPPPAGPRRPTVDDVFVADVLAREQVTDHDVAAFVDVVQERIGAPAGSYIHYGLTSSDVVDTALCATLTRAADLLLADLDALRGRPAGPGPRAHGRAGDRADPRHARRAHHLRGQVRPVGPAGRPGPPPHAPGPRRRSPWASSRGPSAPTPTSTPRSRPTCAPPSASQPVPATQVIARDRHAEYLWACAVGRGHRRAHVHRDPPPGPQRGGGGRGAVRRRAEGQLGHAPQAQPDPLRAPVRPGPPAARLPRRRAGGRGAVARARHLAQLGGAGGAARRLAPGLLHAAQGHRPGLGPGHPRRPGAGQPDQRQLRPGLQPVGAAGAGRRPG